MRNWITGIVSLALAGVCLWSASQPPPTMAAQSAPAPAFSRPQMLQDIATRVIIPGVRDFQTKCEALEQVARRLKSEPGTAQLKQTQNAWTEACLAWKRIQWIQFGPVKDRAYWSSLCFKPVYPQSIEKVLRSPEPITADRLADQGAAAKGIYTLEYLLFDLSQGQNAWVGEDGKPTRTSAPRLSEKLLLEGEGAARRRLYVHELTCDLVERLKEAQGIIDAPDFIQRYVKEGQASVNLAVNGLLDELESGVVNVLRLYVDQFANRTLRYDQIEGYAGGLSVRVLEEELAGLEKLYRGGGGIGMDDYVRHVNPGLNGRLEQRLQAGKEAMKVFGEIPVDQALIKHYAAMERAHDELRELEIQIKLDVVSSLGITLLFSSTDGD